jgi:hypothetical protein
MDIARHHPDTERRQEAEDLVALLTPVIKAACTDNGAESAGLAIGVYGGHGYIAESGVEQLARDARISQIYEGTNGVQALDLVGRKLPMHQGRLLRRFFHRVGDQLAWPPAEGAEQIHGQLGTAFRRLQDTTLWLAEAGLRDPEEASSAATDYLRMFSLVVFGSLWLQMAEACLGDGAPDSAFCEQKLATARFFARRILPETAALAEVITSGKSAIAVFGDQGNGA